MTVASCQSVRAGMGFAEIPSALGVAIKKVLALGAEPEMIGSHASAVVATMQDLQSIGDRAEVELIRVPVGHPPLAAVNDEAITELTVSALPKPASLGLFDLCPEPALGGTDDAFALAASGAISGPAFANLIGRGEKASTTCLAGARYATMMGHWESPFLMPGPGRGSVAGQLHYSKKAGC